LKLRALALALIIAVVPQLGTSAANAHAKLTSANPKQKSVVTVLPKKITLQFNEDLINLEPGNQLRVTDPRGKTVHSGTATVFGNQLSVALRTSKVLGKYRVSYRAISADGHPITGSYDFTLKAKPKPKPKK
jgi:methionine-rich copper-binding protein CopC